MKRDQGRNSWTIDLAWSGCLFAFAVALRVIYGWPREVLADHDSAGFILRAREILNGGSLFHTYHMPGYPLMVGVWSAVAGDYIRGARMASVFSGSLLVVVVYFLGRKLYGRPVAIAAGLLVAINNALIDLAASELSEATYTLFIVAAVAVTVWAVKARRLVIWALAGLLFGFSYWVRPEGCIYLGLIPFLAWAEHWFETGKPLSRDLMFRLGVFLFAGALFVIPNVLFIHHKTGAWTVNGRTVWAALVKSAKVDGELEFEKSIYGLTPDKQAIMLEGGLGKVSMLDSYSENIGFKLRDIVKNWWKTYELLPSVFPVVLVLFLGIGFFRLSWTWQERRSEIYLLGALLPWVMVYPLYEIGYEKLTPAVPFLTLWAGLGVVAVAERIRPAGGTSTATLLHKARNPAIAVAAIVLLVAALELPAYTRPLREADYYQRLEDNVVNRKVGEWIKQNLPKDVTLMARKLYVGAYSGRKTVFLPYADYPNVIAYARQKGVDVIVMDEKFKALRPQLGFLFEDSISLPDLVPIFTTKNEKGQKIILYKIVPAKQAAANESGACRESSLTAEEGMDRSQEKMGYGGRST